MIAVRDLRPTASACHLVDMPQPHDISCCVGVGRVGASAFGQQHGGVDVGVFAVGTPSERSHRRTPARDHWSFGVGLGASFLAAKPADAGGDLLDAGLGQLEMLVEYQLPLTSKRADVVLAGVNRRTGEDAFVVVELKQWSHAELFEQDANLVLVDGMPGGPRLHPLAQAQSYRDYLVDYLRTESKPESVTAVATCTTQR